MLSRHLCGGETRQEGTSSLHRLSSHWAPREHRVLWASKNSGDHTSESPRTVLQGPGMLSTHARQLLDESCCWDTLNSAFPTRRAAHSGFLPQEDVLKSRNRRRCCSYHVRADGRKVRNRQCLPQDAVRTYRGGMQAHKEFCHAELTHRATGLGSPPNVN